ncbi:MAG: hypothetical protein AABW67_03720 [Nanoarchaeota archaeon]
MDFLREGKDFLRKPQELYSKEIKKIYSNLKGFPKLAGLEIKLGINIGEICITCYPENKKFNGLYELMCSSLKKTRDANHPNRIITYNPPEGRQNIPPNSIRKITINVNKEIIDIDEKYKSLYKIFADFNGILKEFSKYSDKKKG